MSINAKTFSFQTRFNINDVSYDIKISSNKEEQERIMGKQVITLMKNTAGVNMVRRETMLEDPEFLMTGVGLMENASEEELKSFAIEWLRLVQEAQMMASVRGGEVMGPLQILGAKEFSEILNHFFPDLLNQN